MAIGFLLLASHVGLAASSPALPCAGEVELRLSTREPVQGGVVLLELAGDPSLEEATARWEDRTIPFWREPSGVHRALLGVDLQASSDSRPLSVSARRANGDALGCSTAVSIRDGEFVVERLTVDRKYVELDPADLARARKESAELRDIFSSFTPERLWQDPFRWPLESTRPPGNFGKRRVLNGEPRSPHSGLDLSAPRGTPIHAPATGRVRLAKELFFSGNTVVLDHGLGLYTFYGHLDSIAVEAGDRVQRGKPLGTVGATGRVTGAHLHWAARLYEARVNPRDLVEILTW